MPAGRAEQHVDPRFVIRDQTTVTKTGDHLSNVPPETPPVEFARAAQAEHRIERCWGILENHWNGALLSTVETTLRWARTMTWRGVAPLVRLLDQVYDTGVRLTKRWFQPIANRLLRSPTLPQWSLTILPIPR